MRALVLLVAAFAVGMPSADAQTPYCNLIRDPQHDDLQNATVPENGSFGSLDLVSGDVASNASTVTTVVRVRELVALEPGSPTGTSYDFIFSIGGSRFLATAIRDSFGDVFNLQVMTDSTGSADNGAATYREAGRVTGVFDEDRSEIRVHVPAQLIRAHSRWRADSRFENFEISANRQAGNSGTVPIQRGQGVFASADNAFAPKAAAAPGRPSCVRVGR